MDYFEVATWCGCDLLMGALSIKKRSLHHRKADRNVSKLIIFLIFVVLVYRDYEPAIWM